MFMLRVLLLPLAVASFAATPVGAEPVADFYRGKRINLVIGYGTGGGYDSYARLLARFLGEHIPGNPGIIAQNMPGAGSRNAANWLYRIAPKDGTVIATLGQATPIDQALGQPGIQFDARRFNWIGNTVVVNNILGTRFRIVAGYPGGGDINLALERGEVDGRGSDSWASIKASNPDWLRDKKINILFQVGPRREADLPDIPIWSELAQNDEQRQILEVLSGDVAVGRPILTAPDVPQERVNALRQAFDETVKDQNFIAAARGANMYFHPMGGEELQRVVARILSPSAEVIDKVKDAIKIKDVQRLPGR